MSVNGASLGTSRFDGSGKWTYSFNPAKGVASGTYVFSATALDLASRVGTPGDFKLQVNGKAPTTTSPLLVRGDLAGLSDDFSPRAGGTPLFVGPATGGSVVTILDGEAFLRTTTADAFGGWAFASPTLPTGKQIITAEATNASGVTGLISAGLTITA